VVLAVLWLILGLAMTGITVWVGWTRWPAVLNGHPALLVVGIACGLLGLIAVAWSVATLAIGDRLDREGDPAHPARRTPEELLRRARWRIILAVPALILCFLMVVVVGYSRPLVATGVATRAVRSENGVRVTERLSWYEMTAVRTDASGKDVKPTTALVFVPGARVDPRAYAALLRPLAQAGYLVTVLKEPFGFALLDGNHAQEVIEVHPEIANWAVGGHSLGGVAAASFADSHPQVKGLVLYASYPANALQRTDLKVVSISGDHDELTTPTDVEKSKAKLPPSTQYVVLPGAVHSFFGDYGDQPGDGQPAADRVASQGEITKATRTLLTSIVPPPKKKKKK
jgi:pimeloyl-ACP methyl ester carboxylesterase